MPKYFELRGDEDERSKNFLVLYARHHASIFGYILSLVPHWSDAEDVLQQTTLILWEKFDEFRSDGNFVAWSCGIAWRKTMELWHRRERLTMTFSAETLAELSSVDEEEISRLEAERRALDDCLKKLTASDRDLLRQCYAKRGSIKEVADRLSRTPNSVSKWVSRINKGLLRCIEKTLKSAGEP